MARWDVEIASVPGLEPGGTPSHPLMSVSAMVEHAVDEGKLVEGSASSSADGRVGGEWIVEASSAEEAATIAGDLLRRALQYADLTDEDAIVGFVRVQPEKPTESDD